MEYINFTIETKNKEFKEAVIEHIKKLDKTYVTDGLKHYLLAPGGKQKILHICDSYRHLLSRDDRVGVCIKSRKSEINLVVYDDRITVLMSNDPLIKQGLTLEDRAQASA